MAGTGGEPTWSMGDDAPMPVLSGRPHLLYDYFKQRFAQVTNPAIDPLREGLVMSLEITLGAKVRISQTQIPLPVYRTVWNTVGKYYPLPHTRYETLTLCCIYLRATC
jgi:hypothetical protein